MTVIVKHCVSFKIISWWNTKTSNYQHGEPVKKSTPLFLFVCCGGNEHDWTHIAADYIIETELDHHLTSSKLNIDYLPPIEYGKICSNRKHRKQSDSRSWWNYWTNRKIWIGQIRDNAYTILMIGFRTSELRIWPTFKFEKSTCAT